MSRQVAREDERGFTLVELMLVILIMGIVFAIASSSWFGAIESRNVDSAANQVAADLRLAHASATNRLVPWRVVLTSGSPNYQLVKPSIPASPTVVTKQRWLPEDTEIGTTKTVEFAGDGSASLITPAADNTVVVRSTDGSPKHIVDFNTTTSMIKVGPLVP